MIRRFACALLLLWTASARAEDAPKPDFSGTWGLDKGRSRLQIPFPDVSVFYIDHREPYYFRLTRTDAVNGQLDMVKLDLETNGKKEDVHKKAEETTFIRSWWEGDRLVLESRIERGEHKATSVMKLSLSQDGTMLTAEESFAGPDVKRENKWVYHRLPQKLDATETDLAEIKAAVLHYYETKKPENWEAFSEELRRGFIFPIEKGEHPRIGIFTLELRYDRLILIRQPPVSPYMMYFGVFLTEHDGQWVVLEDYWEVEEIEFKEP